MNTPGPIGHLDVAGIPRPIDRDVRGLPIPLFPPSLPFVPRWPQDVTSPGPDQQSTTK